MVSMADPSVPLSQKLADYKAQNQELSTQFRELKQQMQDRGKQLQDGSSTNVERLDRKEELKIKYSNLGGP